MRKSLDGTARGGYKPRTVSTWIGLLVETKGDAGFWELAKQLGVERQTSESPGPWVLINCDAGFDFLASVRLAQALSTKTEAWPSGSSSRPLPTSTRSTSSVAVKRSGRWSTTATTTRSGLSFHFRTRCAPMDRRLESE